MQEDVVPNAFGCEPGNAYRSMKRVGLGCSKSSKDLTSGHSGADVDHTSYLV